MIDPLGGFRRIRDFMLCQLETSQRIRDPQLNEARRACLSTPGAFFIDPVVEILPRYKTSVHALEACVHDFPGNPLEHLPSSVRQAFVDWVLSGLFEAEADAASGSLRSKYLPYEHQMQMLLRGTQPGSPAIITSGTGSGKTESFMLPIMASLATEAVHWPAASTRPTSHWFDSDTSEFQFQRAQEQRPAAMRALLIYPMNALVEDQMTRLRKALGSEQALATMRRHFHGNYVTFGRYTSATPPTGFLQHPRMNNAVKRNEKIALLRRQLRAMGLRRQQAEAHDASKHGEQSEARFLFPQYGTAEMLTRWDMHAAPPDILVTNASMLSVMLSREVDSPIFDKTRQWLETDPQACFFLVLDEMHLVRGAAGTEVAGLMRLLIHRLGLDTPTLRHKLRILASSASLPAQGPEAQQSAAYLYDFFGSHGSWTADGLAACKSPHDWLGAIIPGQKVESADFAPFPLPMKPFVYLAAMLSTQEAGFAPRIAERTPELDAALRDIAAALHLDSTQHLTVLTPQLIQTAARIFATACRDAASGVLAACSTSTLEQRMFGQCTEESFTALRGMFIVRALAGTAAGNSTRRSQTLPCLRCVYISFFGPWKDCTPPPSVKMAQYAGCTQAAIPVIRWPPLAMRHGAVLNWSIAAHVARYLWGAKNMKWRNNVLLWVCPLRLPIWSNFQNYSRFCSLNANTPVSMPFSGRKRDPHSLRTWPPCGSAPCWIPAMVLCMPAPNKRPPCRTWFRAGFFIPPGMPKMRCPNGAPPAA